MASRAAFDADDAPPIPRATEWDWVSDSAAPIAGSKAGRDGMEGTPALQQSRNQTIIFPISTCSGKNEHAPQRTRRRTAVVEVTGRVLQWGRGGMLSVARIQGVIANGNCSTKRARNEHQYSVTTNQTEGAIITGGSQWNEVCNKLKAYRQPTHCARRPNQHYRIANAAWKATKTN